MAEVLLFHHVHGLTSGCIAFADDLRAAGHVVHAPDLYDGKTFETLDEGMAYAKEVGFDTIVERGRLAAESLPSELVYGGFSPRGGAGPKPPPNPPRAQGAPPF